MFIWINLLNLVAHINKKSHLLIDNINCLFLGNIKIKKNLKETNWNEKNNN
jgi:hypothetical protein